MPSPADQSAMGQVAHIAEHAAILGHGLLGGVVGVVQGMRADLGKDLGEDERREPLGKVMARNWRSIVIG